MKTDPMPAIERLVRVTNAHDLDGIVACFAEGYTLESPIHPARSFRGRDQVRRNWTQILGALPDITTRVVASACDGATAWTEWEMSGTRHDGVAACMRGVFVFRIEDDLIASGRMFLEPVDTSSGDMDAAVRQVVGR